MNKNKKKDNAFVNNKPKDLLTIIILVAIVGLFGYYYANSVARNKLWVKTYPVRAAFFAHQMSCSNNAPIWMADLLKYQTKKNNAPSNQIAYIDMNGNVHHCENGYVDQYPLLSDVVTENTRFRYASVTKLWTSDAILELVKQDKLKFDTRLTDILTEINSPKDLRINDITIKHLLLHRAGFDRYSIFGQNMFSSGKDICPNHLEKMNDIELGFNVNEKMSYSNFGYCLLGEVIAKINGESYTQSIRDTYGVDKVGMRFIDNAPINDEVYYNHVETDIAGIADIYTAFDYKALASAAGLSGDATELAKQILLMMAKPSPNILSFDESLDCDLSLLRDCYGYAMFPYRAEKDDKMVFYRDGELLGLSTLAVATRDGQVVTLLSNGASKSKFDNDMPKYFIYQRLNER